MLCIKSNSVQLPWAGWLAGWLGDAARKEGRRVISQQKEEEEEQQQQCLRTLLTVRTVWTYGWLTG